MRQLDQILEEARKRISRFGEQEMDILATNLAAMAKQHSLYLSKIDFGSSNLRLMPDSFGYGEEPVVNCLSPFKPGVVGNGATVIYPASLGETTLPMHDYQVVRFITPNVIVSPPAAAKLFCNDLQVSNTCQEIREAFVNSITETIQQAKEKLFGARDVIPYDVIGSMTLVNEPELRVWKSLSGDFLIFRADTYFGLSVLPGRALAAIPGGGGHDQPSTS